MREEETVELRASVAETRKEEACTDRPHGHNADICVIRGTETNVDKKCIRAENVLKVDVHEMNTCVIKGTDTGVEEECFHVDDVLKIDVLETDSSVIGGTVVSVEQKHPNDEDVLKLVTHEYRTRVTGKPESAVDEKDPCEGRAFEKDAEVIKICATGAVKGGIRERDASEDPVHEVGVRENNFVLDSRTDLLDSDTLILKVAPANVKTTKENNVGEEDGHLEHVPGTDTCVTEAMEGTTQEKDASEEPVYPAREHDRKSDVRDLDNDESGVQAVNNHEASNCAIGGKEDPITEENREEVHKLDVHVTSVGVVGETGDSVREKDTDHEDVYKVAADESSISMNGALEISVEKDTNKIKNKTSAPKANDHKHESFSESISDSRSDAENVVAIITLSDTHEADANEDVHQTDAYNSNTGTNS